ncbi:DUF4263 domain-containing protein [Aliarcobacter butzleri]|uniref:Shedu immune nuclease family protein n=1 Tax=Aliarcobacter butzleri TaxID=28197 RepID=UPI00263F4805|nr:Shedu immune nuclease family protein [Aliarcobacter butzleri]MDN5079609.1 DUF4263 domain-containing protein [Aliarcobacter butzleri]
MNFQINNNKLLYKYSPYGNGDWLINRLNDEAEQRVSKIFYFEKKHLVDYTNGTYTFQIGIIDGEYYKIDKNILYTRYDVLIHKSIKITKKIFTAEKDISIFSKIDSIINQQIIIGGEKKEALPYEDFQKLIHDFPTHSELIHYINSRMTNILINYFHTTTDSEKKLNEYLKKRKQTKQILSTDILKDFEKNKYIFVYEKLEEMLNNPSSYVEKDWQKQILEIILLLYPKYILPLENVNIKDYYTNLIKTTNRYIDITLIDVNGNIDIIEIKRPYDNLILHSHKYRDNYIPQKELSGTIMQVEKYIFHLNKWGINGEKELNKKYSSYLPSDLSIKITNPKAILILGREKDFTEEQLMDFEIIKRKYSNIIDLMTYDDLLKRVKNIISKF